MKLLLLGGSGFVSGRVLRYGLEKGHEIICITRGDKPFIETTGFQHIKADRNEDDLSFIADEFEYDAVLDVICQNADHARQAVDLANKCKRLIMVSSDYAYDPDYRGLNLKESEAKFSKFDDYGGYKREAELVLLDSFAAGKTIPTILRPPHIYGSGSNPGTIPQHGRRPHLLDDIREEKTLSLLHAGLGLIQPIHADDLAKIILEVIDKSDSHGEDYSVSGPKLMTHLAYYQTLAKCLGRQINYVSYNPAPDATDVNNYVMGHRYYDLNKLNLLLPEFKYKDFEQGIADWVKAIDEAQGNDSGNS